MAAAPPPDPMDLSALRGQLELNPIPGGQDAPDPFDLGAFQRQLETNYIGRGLLLCAVTDSTMNDGQHLAKEKGAPAGTIIFAEYQTAGRGRVEGRQWNSSERKNLMFTLITRLDDMAKIRLLPMTTSIAMVKACRMEGTNAWIKWPNDVWIGDRKIGGMLIDAAGLACHLIGVGINVNEIFDPVPIPVAGNSQGPTVTKGSLAGFLGKTVSRERVLANFCNEFERLLDMPPEKLLEQFSLYQYLVGRAITIFPNRVEVPGTSYEAICTGFAGDGNMLVRADQGPQSLSGQEVSVRPIDIRDLVANPLLLQTSVHELLTGKWENQLGSLMSLTATPDGFLEGRYHTAVGSAADDPFVRGTWTSADDGGAVLSFSVAWRVRPGAKKSATSWAGRLFFDRETGDMSLVTMWHLVAAVKKSASWSAFNTNQDTFHKLL